MSHSGFRLDSSLSVCSGQVQTVSAVSFRFQVVSGQSSCSARTWSVSGSFLVAPHLSAKIDSSAKGPGRLASSLLLLVSLQDSTTVLLGASR